ncbi:PREDICTED: uncharacterized protein LOC109212486 [Nicotiana attenuata]|uniref:uncharacterized protein LOC109212486 n=1 Tax=Nicotiana attenuata TaxID=49451 RepID=UPI000905A179|nr:PREDICTED: uncharacterized protein LOC109212486 [Nicotiana attenuata]
MRLAPPEETTKPSNLKPKKDNKRKRVLEPKDPQDKKTSTRSLRKKFAQTGTDSAHDSPDGEEHDEELTELVTRIGRLVEAAKPSKLENPPCGEDARREETGKALISPEVEIVPPSSTTMPEGVNAEAPEVNENAPSEELGIVTICHSLSLPTYSREAIEEANTLHMPDPSKVIADYPFQSCYARVEGFDDFNDAPSILKRPSAAAKFRVELSQCEAELKKISSEEKALRLLCGQKEEELKDLRAALAKSRKSESELDEQEAITAQLVSAEAKLRDLEAKGLAQAIKIEGMEAELAKSRTEVVQAKDEAAQTKAKDERMKIATDKSIFIYTREVVAVQAELRAASNQAKWSIRARGFDLAEEKGKAQARETDARFLVSSDDEDVMSGSEDEEGEEDASKGEEDPEDKATGDEDATPRDLAPKMD